MRRSGVLMPLSSLPGEYGIGSMGKHARAFIDFLANAGQSCWQMLPIGPTGYGDSPYQSFSAFAGNPYSIDLDLLAEQGLLTEEEKNTAKCNCQDQVDYAWLYETRFSLLRPAVARLLNQPPQDLHTFFQEEAWWLEDYALFMAIKERAGGISWQEWEEPLRTRNETALLQARRELDDKFYFWCGVQYLFFHQWESLKRYAGEKGITLIGDIPIYVSPDSSDIWASPSLFQVDENHRLSHVAGVPPDGFSADGQLWGNPLYDWDYHQQTEFAWWGRRLRHASRVYDITRIDHFRGFSEYFSIPAGGSPADGCWRPGPGKQFIDSIRRQLPNLQIIAEDLGYLTPDVIELLEYSGYPGMKILQFAFDSREASDYMPYNYQRNSVVYTGTHDNTTIGDWPYSVPAKAMDLACRYLDITLDRSFIECFIRAAFSSVSDLAIIPMPDWLKLGREARINTPSTLGGNWIWRMLPDAVNNELAAHIADLTKLYGR